MNSPSRTSSAFSFAELDRLHGCIVLVESAQDHRNPPSALRGTLEVHPGPAENDPPHVAIRLEFPQMFTTPAHQRTVALSDEEISRLLASERAGTFRLMLDGRLDPLAPAGNE